MPAFPTTLFAPPAVLPSGGGFRFQLYAPHALSVDLLGDFSGWSPLPMHPAEVGLWTVEVHSAAPGQAYQFRIATAEGLMLRKSDPCGAALQLPPLRASVLQNLGHTWQDAGWMTVRQHSRPAPLLIYRLDLHSWRRTASGARLSLAELTPWLIAHVKALGATHVALLPVMDHSRAEGTAAFFSPAPSLVTPQALMDLVDRLHCAGIGVLLHWQVERFSPDPFGLDRFDGTPVYEGSTPLHFCLADPMVQSFLTDAARHWLGCYHADGLLLPDPSLFAQEDAAFWQGWNRTLHRDFPGILTIAAGDGSLTPLGFDAVEQLPRQQALLDYHRTDPLFRAPLHGALTEEAEDCSLLSLPLVTHSSLVEQAAGKELPHRMAGLRTLYLYLLTQPGGVLLPMGAEFAQLAPWNPHQSLDWHLLQNPLHREQLEFFRAAGNLYLASPALWQRGAQLRWIVAEDATGNTLMYLRTAPEGDPLLLAFNFSGLALRSLCVGVPQPGTWEVLLSTDSRSWGGHGKGTQGCLTTTSIPRHGWEQSLFLDLPPMSGLVLRPVQA